MSSSISQAARHWPEEALRFDPAAGKTIRMPLAPGPGYWAGAASALRDPDTGCVYLYYRYRKPRELGRGVECRIARSPDGMHSFEDVWAASKTDLEAQSVEKAGLFHWRGQWRLYLSFVGADGRWRIAFIEAERPEMFDVRRLRPALSPQDCNAEGVKDPALYAINGRLYMFVSYAPQPRQPASEEAKHGTGDIYNTGLTKSHTGLAVSADGYSWRWEGDVLSPPESGWDAYCTRISAIWRAGPFWLGFYDGSASVAENYEERVGLCVSLDLYHWQRLTTNGPWVVSPHASGSVRYVEALPDADGLLLYYEFARRDGSHDLRVQRLSLL